MKINLNCFYFLYIFLSVSTLSDNEIFPRWQKLCLARNSVWRKFFLTKNMSDQRVFLVFSGGTTWVNLPERNRYTLNKYAHLSRAEALLSFPSILTKSCTLSKIFQSRFPIKHLWSAASETNWKSVIKIFCTFMLANAHKQPWVKGLHSDMLLYILRHIFRKMIFTFSSNEKMSY